MNKSRFSVMRRVGRVAVLGAVASVAVGLMSPGAANAETFVPLANGEKVAGPYKIAHFDESAKVAPQIAFNGLNRNAWATGTAMSEVPEGATGTLKTGYLVGCQLDMDDLSFGLDLGAGSRAATPTSSPCSPSRSSSAARVRPPTRSRVACRSTFH